jgi:hypothetical protein
MLTLIIKLLPFQAPFLFTQVFCQFCVKKVKNVTRTTCGGNVNQMTIVCNGNSKWRYHFIKFDIIRTG